MYVCVSACSSQYSGLTSLAGAAQPDRRRTRQQGDIDGIHTHVTSEPRNSPIRPPCGTHALATAHEQKWQCLKWHTSTNGSVCV